VTTRPGAKKPRAKRPATRKPRAKRAAWSPFPPGEKDPGGLTPADAAQVGRELAAENQRELFEGLKERGHLEDVRRVNPDLVAAWERGEFKADKGPHVPDAAETRRTLREDALFVLALRGDVDSKTERVTGVIPPRPGERATRTFTAGSLVKHAQRKRAVAVVYWLGQLLDLGPEALLDAAEGMLERPDVEALETNALAALGDAVSSALQRRLLLAVLNDNSVAWHLGRASDVLGMGGAGNVTKAIVRLGLGEELAKARAEGKALQGRRAKG
jgi:hypothetical protein